MGFHPQLIDIDAVHVIQTAPCTFFLTGTGGLEVSQYDDGDDDDGDGGDVDVDDNDELCLMLCMT